MAEDSMRTRLAANVPVIGRFSPSEQLMATQLEQAQQLADKSGATLRTVLTRLDLVEKTDLAQHSD